MNNEDPEKRETFIINVNLVKINVSMVVLCVLLSYFMEQYEYAKVVYNCLITILIYNNLIFLYLVYTNIRSLWKK